MQPCDLRLTMSAQGTALPRVVPNSCFAPPASAGHRTHLFTIFLPIYHCLTDLKGQQFRLRKTHGHAAFSLQVCSINIYFRAEQFREFPHTPSVVINLPKCANPLPRRRRLRCSNTACRCGNHLRDSAVEDAFSDRD